MCLAVRTYADMYNTAFMAPDKIAWVKQELHRIDGLCLVHHQRALAKLEILCKTQSIFRHDRFETVQRAIGCAIADARRARQHRTRRLVRRMLHHAYTPGGRMMRRAMAQSPFIKTL